MSYFLQQKNNLANIINNEKTEGILFSSTLKVGENKESFIDILGDFDQDIAIYEIVNIYKDN